MSDLLAPLVPADVDLRDFAFMKLDVLRLRDSRIAAAESAEAFRCAVLLWCAAWHQVPAGSLPDDDVELSTLAGFGRAVAMWREHKSGALHGWVKCSDGRLYHPVVAEKAIEAWREKVGHRWRRECDRLRKENKVREAKGLPPLENPPFPAETQNIKAPSGGNGGRAEAPKAPVPPQTGPGRADIEPIKPVPAETPDFPAESLFAPMEPAHPPTEIQRKTLLKGEGEGESKEESPKRAPPVRTRNTYPEDFERFWSAYPTDPNMSKAETAKAWARMSDVDRLSAMAAVPGFMAHCRKDPTYRPLHAVRFLTQRRFDGFLTAKAMTPRSEIGPLIELQPGCTVLESTVVDVIRRGGWIDGWGPGIGKPGCRVPDRLIEDARRTAA